jgi:eukaryotic-like serine/threonine-protein kinase
VRSVDAPVTLGRYELRQPLGTGGMASVYMAVTRSSSGFHKPFALKRMHPHLAQDPTFAAMFFDEARIASSIVHPNVCAVVDYGEVGGELYMAMELLVGEPFGLLLARLRSLPAADRARAHPVVVSLLADACEGLHAAHELEGPGGERLHVVHRDISPHNLMVTYDGVMKVVDFGVARAAGQRHHTTTGEVKGKFSYMAPEQMRGEPVDRRADVWSLGVVLWEALALRPLFRRTSQTETVLAVIAAEVPSLHALDPSIDPALDAIVQAALAPDRGHRYATARDLGRVLRSWALQSQPGMDAGYVAEWMRCLFPQELAAKRERIRELLEPSGITPVPTDAPAETSAVPSQSMVVGRPLARARGAREALGVGVALGALLVVAGVAMLGRIAAEPQAAAPPVIEDPMPDPVASPPAPVREVAEPQEAVAPAEAEASAIPRQVRAEPGQVNVAAKGGWANVYVGHRLLGPTPGTFTLPAGRHVLRLRGADGKELARVPVRVPPGGAARVAVDLTR